jgi:hypothetical protein
MKGSEVKQMVYNKLVNLNYSRKENYLKDANSTNWDTLGDELKEVILMFPSRFVDYDNDLMDIEDLSGEQQFYLFHSKGDTFLVDTQGYNYPRYTILLEGFTDGIDYDGVDDIIDRGTGITRIADQEIFEQVISNLCTDLSEDGFSKKDALVFLQVLLDHKFDCVVDNRKTLFQQ